MRAASIARIRSSDGRVLADVALDARLERLAQQARSAVGGEHDDRRLQLAAQLADDLADVHADPPRVDDHDVGRLAVDAVAASSSEAASVMLESPNACSSTARTPALTTGWSSTMRQRGDSFAPGMNVASILPLGPRQPAHELAGDAVGDPRPGRGDARGGADRVADRIALRVSLGGRRRRRRLRGRRAASRAACRCAGRAASSAGSRARLRRPSSGRSLVLGGSGYSRERELVECLMTYPQRGQAPRVDAAYPCATGVDALVDWLVGANSAFRRLTSLSVALVWYTVGFTRPDAGLSGPASPQGTECL